MRFLLVILLPLASALRYVPIDPCTIALVDQHKPVNASGDTGAQNGHVFVIKPLDNGTLVWDEVECTKPLLTQYLQLDATVDANSTFTNEDSHGHGSCCLNQHHYVCQIMIREINECQTMKNDVSKFGASEPSASCPPS
jgi:hypothetical protein